MHKIEKELRRLSRTLMWSGAAMALCGAGAIMWPEQALIAALIAVGTLAVLAGLYEITIAISIHASHTRWWLVLAHGAASVAFGLLTAGATGLALRVAMIVVAAWLLVYGAIAFTAAALASGLPRVAIALVAWGCLDVALAIVAVAYPSVTIFWLLFFGAAYALAFGLWQLVAGISLMRLLRSHLGRQYDGIILTAH